MNTFHIENKSWTVDQPGGNVNNVGISRSCILTMVTQLWNRVEPSLHTGASYAASIGYNFTVIDAHTRPHTSGVN